MIQLLFALFGVVLVVLSFIDLSSGAPGGFFLMFISGILCVVVATEVFQDE